MNIGEMDAADQRVANSPVRCGQRARRVACTVAIAGVMWAHAVQAIDLPESTNKLQFATKIQSTYLIPLKLTGKSAAYAVEKLLGEGFRCRIEPYSVTGIDDHPLTHCIKKPSGFGPLCEELLVTTRFERQGGIASREDLFRQLDSIKVVRSSAFCPYAHEVSAEYLTMQSAAEETLRDEVGALELTGNAKAAYDKLLLGGFYCGFALGQGAEGGPAKLVCTKLPSGIKFCFEAKLIMDVVWPAESMPMKQLFGALPSAQIEAVRSSCEIPAIKSGGRPT